MRPGLSAPPGAAAWLRGRARAVLAPFAVVLACTDEPRPPAARPSDARPVDAAPADGGGDLDAARREDGAAGARADSGGEGEDAAARDARAAEDAGTPDAGVADAGRRDVGACAHVVLEERIVACPAGYRYARRMGVQPARRACPEYVTLQGARYASVRAAIQGEGCRADCVWRPFRSVSFIDHCGRRNGYIVFRAGDPEVCPDLYELSSGIFESLEAWEAATPC